MCLCIPTNYGQTSLACPKCPLPDVDVRGGDGGGGRHLAAQPPQLCLQVEVKLAQVPRVNVGQGGAPPRPQPCISSSAVKRSIGFTIGFHNHGEGPY